MRINVAALLVSAAVASASSNNGNIRASLPSSSTLASPSLLDDEAVHAFEENMARSLVTSHSSSGCSKTITKANSMVASNAASMGSRRTLAGGEIQTGVTGEVAVCVDPIAHSSSSTSSNKCSASDEGYRSKTCSYTDAQTKKKVSQGYKACCPDYVDNKIIADSSTSSMIMQCHAGTDKLKSAYGACTYYGRVLYDGPSKAAFMANGTDTCTAHCALLGSHGSPTEFFQYVDNKHMNPMDKDFSACCACGAFNKCYDWEHPGVGSEAYISAGSGTRLAKLAVAASFAAASLLTVFA
jgi:hypothetical protein